MMSFISIPLVTVAWLLVGYTIAFSDGSAGGLVGSLKHIGMLGINPDTARGPVPELLFATFQLGFAIVTAALVSGAIADRAKFAAWMAFVPLWTIAVAVVAHWVWEPCGWLFELGALDYAGGLVVEIVSGMSALALAHRRADPRRQADHIRCSLSVVAGLVAIVGLAAAIVCSFAVAAKFRFGYDDSLDVIGVHFVGGVVGVLLIGLLATEVMTGGRKASSMAADSHSSASMRWAHLWSACTRSSCRTCWPR